jgi:hypothetical protein
MTPSCRFEERVAAYASGAPDDELSAHLPGCDACRAELDATRLLLRQVAALGRTEPEGELFWADFARGVRAKLPPPPARGRLAWLAAPALAAAAALVWMLAARSLTTPSPGTPLPPSALVAGADPQELPPDDVDELLPFDAADATAHVAELDDAQLDDVLARLEPDDAGDGGEPDPFEAFDAVSDDQLDAVAASFAL